METPPAPSSKPDKPLDPAKPWGAAIRAWLRDLAGLIFPLFFIYVYLTLVQKQVGAIGPSSWANPLKTETAFFVYGVLLAGMTGSLIKQIVVHNGRSAARTAPAAPGESASLLFVGALAGFAAAVLLPTALLIPPAPDPQGHVDPLGAANKYGLIVLAAIVGYLSREALAKVTATVRDLLDAQTAAADIEGRVEAGLRKAIAPPPLINFRGTLAAFVQLGDGRPARFEDAVLLVANETVRLNVLITSAPSDASRPAGTHSPLIVTGGEDGADASFDITVDGSRLGLPIQRRTLTVGTSDASEQAVFEITPGMPGDGDRETARDEIRISVYQGAVFCGEASLAVRIAPAKT